MYRYGVTTLWQSTFVVGLYWLSNYTYVPDLSEIKRSVAELLWSKCVRLSAVGHLGFDRKCFLPFRGLRVSKFQSAPVCQISTKSSIAPLSYWWFTALFTRGWGSFEQPVFQSWEAPSAVHQIWGEDGPIIGSLSASFVIHIFVALFRNRIALNWTQWTEMENRGQNVHFFRKKYERDSRYEALYQIIIAYVWRPAAGRGERFNPFYRYFFAPVKRPAQLQ